VDVETLQRDMGRVYVPMTTSWKLLDRILLFHKFTALAILYLVALLVSLLAKIHLPAVVVDSTAIKWLLLILIPGFYITGEYKAKEHISATTRNEEFYKPISKFNVYFSHGGRTSSYFWNVLTTTWEWRALGNFLSRIYGTTVTHTEAQEHTLEIDDFDELGLNAYYETTFFPKVYHALMYKFCRDRLTKATPLLMDDYVRTSMPEHAFQGEDMGILTETIHMVLNSLLLKQFRTARITSGFTEYVPLKNVSHSQFPGSRG
jgi:hypothetical protein